MTTPDPLYVAARRVLLDALQALGEQRNAVVLVGAQAIYLRVGEADFEVTVAPYTTDADLARHGLLGWGLPRCHRPVRRTLAGRNRKLRLVGRVRPLSRLRVCRA